MSPTVKDETSFEDMMNELSGGTEDAPEAAEPAAEPAKAARGRKPKIITTVEDAPLMMPGSERLPDDRTLLEMQVGAATLRKNHGG